MNDQRKSRLFFYELLEPKEEIDEVGGGGVLMRQESTS